MQALSLSLVIGFAAVACLVFALAILASPLFAAIIFVIVFGAFLVWRGSRRARTGRPTSHQQARSRVPSTEEASYDPVEDSVTGPAAR
jgi:membrane protein implicated in regulation of membrane protease activity